MISDACLLFGMMSCLVLGGCARGEHLGTSHAGSPGGDRLGAHNVAMTATWASPMTHDGNFWCFDVHNPNKVEALSNCSRTRARCEEVRDAAVERKKEPSECTAQPTAFCLDLLSGRRTVEMCMRTEPQCRQLTRNVERRYEVKSPCAERKNDKPPSGGVATVAP